MIKRFYPVPRKNTGREDIARIGETRRKIGTLSVKQREAFFSIFNLGRNIYIETDKKNNNRC